LILKYFRVSVYKLSNNAYLKRQLSLHNNNILIGTINSSDSYIFRKIILISMLDRWMLICSYTSIFSLKSFVSDLLSCVKYLNKSLSHMSAHMLFIIFFIAVLVFLRSASRTVKKVIQKNAAGGSFDVRHLLPA